jgi:hypothetical protein
VIIGFYRIKGHQYNDFMCVKLRDINIFSAISTVDFFTNKGLSIYSYTEITTKKRFFEQNNANKASL